MAKEKKKKAGLDTAVDALVAIGAINWGLYGLDPAWDLVAMLLGTMPMVQQAVYVLVGLSGLWFAYKSFA